MKLCIVDKARTTSFDAPQPFSDNLFAKMRALKRHVPASSLDAHQVEFVCDKEFYTTLEAEATDANKIETMPDALARPSLDNIPIVIMES
jgi:hypothetical protein